MKKSNIYNIIFGMCLIFLSQSVHSQICSIDNIDPSYFEFPSEGGSLYVQVHSYPYNCGPSLSFPSWLNMYQLYEEEYFLECDPNSGSSRTAYISVGNDYLLIYQAGDPLDGGSIGGPNGEPLLLICYNTIPGVLTNQGSASGGDCSPYYDYQWQISSDGINFTDIQNATGISYTPVVALTSDKYYRRKVSCYGVESFSNELYVQLLQLSPGSVGSNQTINYNSSPLTLSNISSATGSSNLIYQWQKSIDGGITWTDIPNGNGSTYSSGSLSQTTTFRRKVFDYFNTNCPGYSNLITIQVIQWSSPDITKNFVYLKEPLVGTDKIENLTEIEDVRGTIQYYDGLGREIQNIQMLASPDQNDIITPIQYDEFGRVTIKYLPYKATNNLGNFATDPFSSQQSYYDAQFPSEIAFAKTIYENSPLNRSIEQGAPGKTWQPYDQSIVGSGHTTKYVYDSNTENEVIKWQVVGDVLNKTGFYSANSLYKLITKNENWEIPDGNLNTTEEFKDLQGKVVLKRTYVFDGTSNVNVETYYVYDDFGLLRYVLTPKATENIGTSNTFTSSTPIIKDLCYYYKYNKKQLLSEKQLPGTEKVYMVYDPRNRLVLTQDGIFRSQSKWLFTKYDILNRPVLTGEFPSENNLSTMESLVEGVYNPNSPRKYFVERKTSQTETLGFEDESFPKSTDVSSGSLKYYTATYYDNYDFPDKKTFETTLNISEYVDTDNTPYYFDFTTGLVTGSKSLVLESSDYITSTLYFDNKYRPIQSLKNLYGDNNGLEVSSTQYDFVGNTKRFKQMQFFDNSTTTIDKYNLYDHFGRLLKSEYEINNSGTKLNVAELIYNDLGLLKQEGLNKINDNYLQKVDYEYNIRGWLNKINDPENLIDPTNSNADLFSLKLFYEDPSSLTNLTNVPQFNGNISGMIWNRNTSQSVTQKNAYSYIYDEINRLKNSYYGDGISLVNSENNREFDYTYDCAGNLLSLKRNNTTGNLIDNLTYSYFSNGLSNQLRSVVDLTSIASGFDNGNTSTNDDYLYDENGNVKKDLNKGFTSLTYNYLNLPRIFEKDANNKITYFYDALGTKLKQVKKENGIETCRYYLDGFEYDNSKDLNLVQMDEGVINVSSNATIFEYEYHLKDHLGNTRIAFKNNNGSPLLIQSIDYYPFGLQSIPVSLSGSNKYLYNGKELQDELSLDLFDYGARFYDPQLGRWHSIDPLTEIGRNGSPYMYCMNNPMRFIDPNGMLGEDKVDLEERNPFYAYYPDGTLVTDPYGMPITSGGNEHYYYGNDNQLSEVTRKNPWRSNRESSQTEPPNQDPPVKGAFTNAQTKKLAKLLNIPFVIFMPGSCFPIIQPFFGAGAVAIDGGGYFVGAEADAGIILMLKGNDSGWCMFYGEKAAGGGTSASAGGEITRFDYTGGNNNIQLKYLEGVRDKFQLGADAVGDASLAVSWSVKAADGNRILGTTFQYGVGGSVSFIGFGWNKGIVTFIK